MTNIQELYANPWLSLKTVVAPEKGIGGYVFSHEESCQGIKVAVLPYRKTTSGMQFLVKSEVTPCWGLDPVKSAVTGGYEGEDVKQDAVREMLEETGYLITEHMLQDLGTCYASKSADTVYHLFAVDVTDLEQGEALGDGTRLESEALCFWLFLKDTAEIQDAQFQAMVLRLMLASS